MKNFVKLSIVKLEKEELKKATGGIATPFYIYHPVTRVRVNNPACR